MCVCGPPPKRPLQHPHHHHPHHHPRGIREPAVHAHTHVSAQPYRKHVVPRNRGTQAHDRQGTIEMRDKLHQPGQPASPHNYSIMWCADLSGHRAQQAGRPQHACTAGVLAGAAVKTTPAEHVLCMHPRLWSHNVTLTSSSRTLSPKSL